MSRISVESDIQYVESNVQFWALVGPLSILLVLMVCLFKSGFSYLYLPIVGVAGIPVCWKWKMKGLTGCLFTLFILVVMMFYTATLQDLYWLVGIPMAIGLGLVATLLSFEEADAIVSQLQVESNSRLENLWKLDERLKQAQDHWRSERQGLASKMHELTRDLSEKEGLAATWEKAVTLVRKDLDASEDTQDRLLDELFEKRTELVRLKQLVEESKVQIKVVSPELEALIRKQRDLLNHLRCECFQHELIAHGDTTGEAAHIRRIRQLEGLYQQLREQFDEKSQVLDETRKELFIAQEQSLAQEREWQESQLVNISDCEVALERQIKRIEKEKSFAQAEQSELQALQALVAQLFEELSKN